MDNTTLHTFLFHCPAALRSVVLFGSWDNFSRPYPLELDERGGRNTWKGCFTFSDIICDGDLGQQSPKRDGALRMGGTYWYYYKVDEDEEWHNPAQESTTFCPLLPGQRLNVLDVPHEGHSRSMSDTSAAFTRNPKDRYLTPVPPAPLRSLPSPRTAASSETDSMPLPSPWTPRSATYPPADGFLAPHVVRHARSASASPHMPSTPIFPDFKVLKEKLASKRSASRNRSGSKTRELDISAPVLVSGGEDLNLIPLSVYRPSIESLRAEPAIMTSVSRPVPTIRREFSPLTSHPVDPTKDSLFLPVELPTIEERPIRRRRSHIPSTVITSEFKVGQHRTRANSADTRRTRHYLFSNDPWLSSPKLQQDFDLEDRVVKDDTPSAPILSRPSSLLQRPTTNERPTSSHGSIRSTKLHQSPRDKALPALPHYLTPAPLYATTISELPASPTEAEDEEHLHGFQITFAEKARSHFSTWSHDSIAYTSDDEPILSPTFSSLTSNDSDTEPPQGLLLRVSYPDTDEENTTTTTKDTQRPHLSATPPQLNELRISTFGSDLFPRCTSDTASSRRSSRRQATCFGLGFQYCLPDDEQDVRKSSIEGEGKVGPGVGVQRESSVSQIGALVDEFGFLGEVVG
ncbi:hypothetical protein BDW02DRAFT_140711 [Decorospora gaudefroyi]|uniref:AMP-activated protein kinase glycogen-binding domain-containing protein n=1 Tax=Decorospora gaudefroyi TaxID=184978 RepID=A0A6A5KUV8_9PLEO|nr:hypothetical protein BDW02DRAFT_140711 [Decorospora gaudefroyi]